MKEILLDKKWIGAMALTAFALIVAIFSTNMGVKIINELAPVVEQKVGEFLPITVSDGEIVAPKDTVISKTYGSGINEARVILDTRIDEFETSSLKDRGVYISRKYIYAVSANKTEIRDIANFPNMTIDDEVMSKFFEVIKDKAGYYIFFGVFIMYLGFAACAIGLYTLVMYWPLKALYHGKFECILRINTLAYIIISALTMLIGFNISIIMTFVLLFGANCGVYEGLKKLKEKQ